MGKERVEFKMSGYDLPIQDNNEREWYANVGRIQEQERIIKLLEDNCECMFEINEYYSGCNNHRNIALIKGEK